MKPGRWFGLVVAVLSCGGPPAGEPRANQDSTPAPADTLVLRAGAVEVWWTAARSAVSATGDPCIERALEIRRNGERRTVPLLYTRETPTVLDDTTMRAVLYTACAPVGAYRVDYATASPRRMTAP